MINNDQTTANDAGRNFNRDNPGLCRSYVSAKFNLAAWLWADHCDNHRFFYVDSARWLEERVEMKGAS